MQKSGPNTIRALQILVVGAVVAPILIFFAGGWLAYRDTVARADANLSHTLAVAEEHVIDVLNLDRLVGNLVNNEIGGMTAEAIEANEAAFHERLTRVVGGVPQIGKVWVLDREGHDLLSSATFPVDRSFDGAGRQYFQALQNPAIDLFIDSVRSNRDHSFYFTVARRKEQAPGQFDGVIVMQVSSDYFVSFFGRLVGNSPDFSGGLYREDGSVLARFPAINPAYLKPGPNDLLTHAVAEHPMGGTIAGRAAVDGTLRLVTYHKLDGYPIYVALAQSRASILRQWGVMLLPYAAFGLPMALALILLSLTALTRVRREQAASRHAQEALQQREIAEAALRQSQKVESLGLLTAGIAHDFNNVLAAVLGNLDLMPLRIAADRVGDLKALIEGATRAAERGAKMTAQLLAFARRSHLEPQAFDVNALIREVGDLLRRTLGPAIALAPHLADDLWPVWSEASQIEAAIVNLAINARDAMPDGGTLSILTDNLRRGDPRLPPELAAGDYVRIEMVDSGLGMSEEVRARAFEPFFTTKEVGKGTGLGLSMVYGVARQSGGTCTIRSEPGHGATVALYLPRASASADAAADEAAPTALVTDALEILLIDDDDDVREFVAAALIEAGHAVTEARSGEQGLEILSMGQHCELMIVDYAMPAMTGAEVARRARLRRPNLPIILITGYTSSEDVELPPGARLLNKPFRTAELHAEIRRTLQGVASAELRTS